MSPRWGHLDPPAQIASLALLGLLPLALVLWLYRYELRLVRRCAAAFLLGLRVLVLLLLWCVVAWQPVLARSTTEEIPGRVVIAVDRSGSTLVTDPQRTADEKQHLARALKIDGAAGVVDALTRAEVARRILADDGAGLLRSLAAKHHVELIAFDRGTWDVEPVQLDALLRGKPGPNSSFTDLRSPLLRTAQRSGVEKGKTLGVVLLTDGQHNWGPSPLKLAAELGGNRVPVFAVGLGAKKSPPDVALLEVKAPANVFKDVDAAVEARVKVSGLPAQEIVVELHRGKGPPPEEHVKRIKHDGSDRVYSVAFQVRMEQAGTQTVEVKVRPTLKDTKETSEENNSRAAAVRVAADRAKVLLIDGEARWEYHYLANALRRDRSVESDSVVFVQPRVGRIAEAELEKIGNPKLALPKPDDKGDDPLLRYDCVILGDVSPEQLPVEDRRRLERYVNDRGGTLVLLAGKRFLPLAYGGDDDPLLKMLPIEEARAVGPAAGFPVTLTHEGQQTPFLQLDSAPEESARRWSELPRHFWGLIGAPKPGAVALAYLADDLRPKDSADKKDNDGLEKTQSLLVRQNYGFGRVLLVGLDSTWRWRYRVGDTYHHRFWGQLVRWAASDQLLPAGNRHVRYGTRDPVYRQGQEAAIVARLGDDVPPLAPGTPAAARVHRQNSDGKEETVALVELKRDERQPRLLAGAVRDLPPGQYRVELVIPELADKLNAPPDDDDKSGPKRDAFTVLAAEGSESVELATNWLLLESLASAGKGELLAAEEVGRLVELLNRRVETRERHEEQKLWQDAPLVWVLLGLVLALLSVEWVGRKLAGLP